MAHVRKISTGIQEMIERVRRENEENPVVKTEIPEVEHITKKEDIIELQEILVQTCIDYINKRGLTDIYAVSFNADSLNESATYGSWQSCTDSYIKVEGINDMNLIRKNGKIDKFPTRYKIGEYC